MFGLFKRNKKKYPETAKYQLGDFVNFRYLNELYFGYIYDAEIDENDKIVYTIQIGGQCPQFIYKYKEENIIGLKKR